MKRTTKRTAKPAKNSKPKRKLVSASVGAGDNPAEPVILAAKRAIEFLQIRISHLEETSPVAAFERALQTFRHSHGKAVLNYSDGTSEATQLGGGE